MERGREGSGASPVELVSMKAKVALAVAIIKTKPRGMSGREHAEALASRLRSQEESWKEKAQQLQQEVLGLRQALLISRLTAYTNTSTENTGDDITADDISQDLFGPEGLVLSAALHSDCDSETPDLLLQDLQPDVTSPYPAVPSNFLVAPQGNMVNPNMQFLHMLCALHRVGRRNKGLEALWFSPDGDTGSVLVDTVCQLIESVMKMCRDPPPLRPHDLVLQACQVSTQAMDLFCTRRIPSVEFKKHVEESLRELTAMLLHSNHHSRFQPAEKLMEYLITLGSSSMSKCFLIGHILSQISDLADRLWQVFQGQESSVLERFPVDQYQNSCCLFWILEELLKTSAVPCRAELESEQMGFLSNLEQRVFLLSDEFPLFSIYLWRIGGLFTSSETKTPPSASKQLACSWF